MILCDSILHNCNAVNITVWAILNIKVYVKHRVTSFSILPIFIIMAIHAICNLFYAENFELGAFESGLAPMKSPGPTSSKYKVFY